MATPMLKEPMIRNKTVYFFIASLLWSFSHIMAADEPLFRPLDGIHAHKVEFWTQIYTVYDSKQGLIHEADRVERVLEVIDLTQTSQRQVRKKIKHWTATLHRRVRFQQGLKDHFVEGIQSSGRYLAEMEKIFAAEGLPTELTRLPFVESSFNLKARSRVGASGIWQFMKPTGRRYLKIGPTLDERNDPLRATEAAAKLLKAHYERLGDWPLAITAYNHGVEGVSRAVKKVKSTRLEDVIDRYPARSFGFASSNFYAEFLAALQAETHAEEVFGPIVRQSPVPTFSVELPESILLSDLAGFMKFSTDPLPELNPALSQAVFHNKRPIPQGTKLRLPLPEGKTPDTETRIFLAVYDKIPKIFRKASRRRN